ncbi:MAG: response regulator [Treponema sp.]|jgi:signal transduction histidine kinase/DNA-binding response OmpR family regulator|nr:response regulator [Treponema sp.]
MDYSAHQNSDVEMLLSEERSSELEKHNSLLRIMNETTTLMFRPDIEDYFGALNKSMEKIGRYLEIDRMTLWQNRRKAGGKLYFKQAYRWWGEYSIIDLQRDEYSYQDTLPLLEDILSKGKTINGPVDLLSSKARGFLEAYRVCSLLVVPIFTDGEFWGFVSLEDCNRRHIFSENDVSILQSWGLLAVNTIQRYKYHKLVNVINDAAAFLLTSDPENYEYTINQGMKMVSQYMIVDRLSIWQNYRENDEKLRYKMIFQWTKDGFQDLPEGLEFAYQDTLPSWLNPLSNEESVNGPVSRFPENEQLHLEPHGIQSILVVPIFLKGEFWGFVGYDDLRMQRIFPKEEAYALRSWGLIVVSAMQRGGIARDMRHTLDKLEAVSRAKSVFLANMSHEIRTPMNSVIGFSELALDGAIDPKTKEYLNKILENSEWLLQIINDILDLSKIESGKMELENIPFDVHELFAACRTLIMPKAEEKGIMLRTHTEPSINKRLLGDPTRLRQVIINLLSNAVKFTNTGEIKMSVASKGLTDGKITIHFEIEDSGIGMTDGQIVKIFEPFTQAESGTTRKYGGTGLGLAITKNIINLMGGSLCVKSAPGLGSNFSFNLTFKAIDAPELNQPIKAKLIEKPVFKGEVLLCEDNKMNQQVICEHLARVGLKTVVTENGKEGVEAVKHHLLGGKKRFDLIFMDIHMPVMDGLEAASEIIKLDTGTPIIAMTANIMSDDREQYTANGMADCVGKPFTSQDLWKCLLKYLTPVNKESVNETMSTEADKKLRHKLIQNFVKENQTRYQEIINAIDMGDFKLAHRLAHTLKSNAGLLGKTGLQKAAADAESRLKDEKNLLTPMEKSVLKTELDAALNEFVSLLDSLAGTAGDAAAPIEPVDSEKIQGLIEELEPLLESGNPECLNLINRLRSLPGSEKLIEQIEYFNFDTAMDTLAELKENWR